MDELILQINGECHPSLNKWQKKHWAVNDEDKHRWHWMIRAAIGRHLGEGPFTDVFIEYHFPDIIHRDKDNYAPKFILDKLKFWGMIKSDSARVITVDWEIIFNAERKKTVITLRNK